MAWMDVATSRCASALPCSACATSLPEARHALACLREAVALLSDAEPGRRGDLGWYRRRDALMAAVERGPNEG